MPDPTASLKNIVDAADVALRIVDELVGRASRLKLLFAGVVSMPAEAESAIEEILEEVEKSLKAVDAATREFLAAVQSPGTLLDNEDRLHELSGSFLPKLVEDKRGHCDRIRELDWRYLNGALNRFFSGSKRGEDEARQILNELSEADNDMFRGLAEAAVTMRNVAREGYRLKLSDQRKDAETLLREAGLRLLNLRDGFNDALVRMAELKREFVKERMSRRK
ncbi:hypothetical protein [Roseitranquillus sediminis]|uniref:hypothetical protein n=1 Tax=Roseitranquillus sediminis TaxID=2809051 RepID=UPI001D0C9ED8|nr:hypothetical protein [Roseitranquillus sediminis]MBM9596250.1 hypothetical protein [Roseitranquillus sediminis]